MALPAGTYYPAGMSLYDESTETGTLEVYSAAITAANYDAQQTLWTTLHTAINAMTIGTPIRYEYGGRRILAVKSLPGTNLAQRENKLQLFYQDAVNGEPFTVSIPTVDLTKVTFLTGAKDFVSITAPTEMADLVAAFEAFVKNPRNGNAVTVVQAKFVGRNS